MLSVDHTFHDHLARLFLRLGSVDTALITSLSLGGNLLFLLMLCVIHPIISLILALLEGQLIEVVLLVHDDLEARQVLELLSLEGVGARRLRLVSHGELRRQGSLAWRHRCGLHVLRLRHHHRRLRRLERLCGCGHLD